LTKQYKVIIIIHLVIVLSLPRLPISLYFLFDEEYLVLSTSVTTKTFLFCFILEFFEVHSG